MSNYGDEQASEVTAPEAIEKCAVGTLVIDLRRQRMGRVMGHEGPYLQLRPPGGCEWDADPAVVREAQGDEILRASVHEVIGTAEGRRA